MFGNVPKAAAAKGLVGLLNFRMAPLDRNTNGRKKGSTDDGSRKRDGEEQSLMVGKARDVTSLLAGSGLRMLKLPHFTKRDKK